MSRLNHAGEFVLLFQKLPQKEIFPFGPIAIIVSLSLRVLEFLEHFGKQDRVSIETFNRDMRVIDYRLSARIEHLALGAMRLRAHMRFYEAREHIAALFVRPGVSASHALPRACNAEADLIAEVLEWRGGSRCRT